MFDTGTTAFMIVCTMLVLLMTPGLAFFYGGLSRRKNVVNTMMMVFGVIGVVGVIWVLFGWSFAYGGDGALPFFGGIDQIGCFSAVTDMFAEESVNSEGLDYPSIVNIGKIAKGDSRLQTAYAAMFTERYGSILQTPKLAWRGYGLRAAFADALGIPVAYDTDVNVACLGEAVFGCCKGLKDAVYVTIGTGVGAGVMCAGRLLHGMLHPEAGHMLVRTRPTDVFRQEDLSKKSIGN